MADLEERKGVGLVRRCYEGARWDDEVQQRFWSYVNRRGPQDCWLWTGTTGSRGYGRISIDNRSYSVHRLLYVKEKGPIDPKLVCDHLCRNPGCVNPRHIEPVTNRENVLRGMAGLILRVRNASVTACPKGHPYTPENTLIGNRNSRNCRTCNRERMKAQRHASALAMGKKIKTR